MLNIAVVINTAQFSGGAFHASCSALKIFSKGSYKHKLYTETINKLALNPLDDKVYICNNKTDTLTFGHYRISQTNI